LPYHAIDYCLKTAGITLKDVDHIAYSFDPYLLIPNDEKDSSSISIPFKKVGTTKNNTFNLWDNLFLSSIINSPRMLVDGYPHHLQNRFKGCTVEDWEWHFVDH